MPTKTVKCPCCGQQKTYEIPSDMTVKHWISAGAKIVGRVSSQLTGPEYMMWIPEGLKHLSPCVPAKQLEKLAPKLVEEWEDD